MSSTPDTVLRLLDAGAGDATCINTPGGKPLTYGALRDLAARTVATLNARGVGRGDRVAIVLDNGPEMAVAFLCISAGTTAAPLNPAYRADEFEFYLSDLNAKILIVAHDKATPAIDVAEKLAIPIVRLKPTPEKGSGSFTLVFPDALKARSTRQPGPAAPDDIALVLHTSGTTSRPKIVPLAQQNICASARNIRTTLALTAADRGLAIMPLFHIHGLMASVLAPISAGSEVWCPGGFNALKFFSWLAEVHPTWYTAVPTMHQTILARAGKNLDIVKANRLRFIRSSSSSLAPQVIRELEEVFGAPVIESYGMTEAAHQMASNPLPPAQRKPGTVGVPAGPEVCVIDTDGNPQPAGVPGEPPGGAEADPAVQRGVPLPQPGRVEQGDRSHWADGGQLERDPAAEGVPGQVRGGDAEFGQQAGHGFGQGPRAGLGGRCQGGVAEAGQVDRDDVEVLGERGDDRVPGAAVQPDPVQQHERGAGARAGVGKC